MYVALLTLITHKSKLPKLFGAAVFPASTNYSCTGCYTTVNEVLTDDVVIAN